MTTTNAKRQAAYKDRMRKEGFQQVQIWIQTERKEVLLAFAKSLRKNPLYDTEVHLIK